MYVFGVGGGITGGGRRLRCRSRSGSAGWPFFFPHVDVGAAVVFVFAGEVFFGGEEDLFAVGGHAVKADALVAPGVRSIVLLESPMFM